MEFFKEVILNKKPSLKAASSLLSFEGAHCFKVFQREKPADAKTLIKNINLSLNEKEKRNHALSLLLLILPQCDNTTLSTHGEIWCKLLPQASNSSSSICERMAIFKIMTFILKKAGELKDLRTKISKLNNASFLCSLYSPKLQSELIQPALECLYEYLILYPGESLKYKNDIEKFVCSFLNSSIKYDSKEVDSAARVFAVLPMPRSGANDGKGPERGTQLMQLITFAHHVLDVLFKGVNETEEYGYNKEAQMIPIETLESAKILKDPIQLCLSASLLISNTMMFISEFLSSCNCNFINISHKVLLSLVSRMLQVETNMVNHLLGQEMELLSYFLPSLHIRALSLLQKIIHCKIGSLFYGIIGEQLVATLKSTSQMLRIRSHKKEDKVEQIIYQGELVKVMAYKTLATLIQVADGRHKLPADLLFVIKKDIEISKDFVALKAVKVGELSLNLKKKKKKGYSISEDDLKTDPVITKAEISLRVPSAIAALNLVNALFLHAHHSMQRSLQKGLRDILVVLLKTSLKGVYIFPEVRASLYKAVLAYARYPHPLYPLDYNTVHYGLMLGCGDEDKKVRQICKEGLSMLSFIMLNPQISKLSDISRLQIILGVSKEDDKISSEEVGSEPSYEFAEIETDNIENEDDSDLDNDISESENIENVSSDDENDNSDSYLGENVHKINDGGASELKSSVCKSNIESMESSQESSIGCLNANSVNTNVVQNIEEMEDDVSIYDVSDDNDDEDVNEVSEHLDEEQDITIVEDSLEPFVESQDTSASTKEMVNGKRKKQQKMQKTKLKKVEQKDSNVSFKDMLDSLVDADPDSDQ